jgi:hypothetical protein
VIDRIRHRAGAEHTIRVAIGRAKVELRRLRTGIPMGSPWGRAMSRDVRSGSIYNK